MPEPENPKVKAVREIADPVRRAAAAQAFIKNGRLTIGAMEEVRDEALREARNPPRQDTIDQLAAKVGCGRHVVVDANRRRGRKG